MTDEMRPLPYGTVVDYRGSQAHGRYVVTDHTEPQILFPEDKWHLLAEAYPDGVAYTLWPEGMEQKFGNRGYMVFRARRKSLTAVNQQGGTWND